MTFSPLEKEKKRWNNHWLFIILCIFLFIIGCVLHIDIIDNKIWIQYDSTKIGIAGELVAKGVPKQDIVLSFHSPYKRQFTEFVAN